MDPRVPPVSPQCFSDAQPLTSPPCAQCPSHSPGSSNPTTRYRPGINAAAAYCKHDRLGMSLSSPPAVFLDLSPLSLLLSTRKNPSRLASLPFHTPPPPVLSL